MRACCPIRSQGQLKRRLLALLVPESSGTLAYVGREPDPRPRNQARPSLASRASPLSELDTQSLISSSSLMFVTGSNSAASVATMASPKRTRACRSNALR